MSLHGPLAHDKETTMAKRHCRYGKIRKGPRKGHCRKSKKH